VNGVLQQAWLWQSQLAPAAELDGSGAVVSRFVYATRVNVPDYIVNGGIAYRLVLDQLGSVRLVVNTANGVVAQRLDYDEFGRITQNTNPGFQPFGFAGGLSDDETGLLRLGAREYSPEIGRWVARDPIDFRGGNANLYSYVFSDPVNYADPSGLSPELGDQALEFYMQIYLDACAAGGARVGAFVLGHFAALWTRDTWWQTGLTLLGSFGVARWVGRPFWRYVNPGSSPEGPWLTRGPGWRPPFGRDFEAAKDALQLPKTPTDVIRVQPKWYEPVIGPRPAVRNPQWGPGGGTEYFRGWRFPN